MPTHQKGPYSFGRIGGEIMHRKKTHRETFIPAVYLVGTWEAVITEGHSK